MKVNWFSPIPPAQTGIAEYTITILPYLCAQTQVIVWSDQAKYDKRIEKWAKVRRYGPGNPPWREINSADISVFNMGNNAAYHEGLWRVARAHGGVVVLHDLRLQDLFWSMCLRDRSIGYEELMGHHYGARGANAAESVISGRLRPDELATTYPLTQAALENAAGVVVHTTEGFDIVQKQTAQPVAYLNYPYAAASEETFAGWKTLRKENGREPLKVVLLGYLNPNRRIESILRAMAGARLRRRLSLHIYGPVWDQTHVTQLASSLNLLNDVHLHGYIPNGETDRLIADADLAINLRFPTMGEASMTQLQFWDHALPTIVTRTGWYASLPHDTALFIEQDREIELLQQYLSDFAENPAAFRHLGLNGRERLIAVHQPTSYASDFSDFLKIVLANRHTAQWMNVAAYAGSLVGGLCARESVDRILADAAARGIMSFLAPGSRATHSECPSTVENRASAI
ncbi:MAG TPA: glycosyltransferase [Bryobacteraceae bacterium]|nr:glycosyltransferase [Bryobacteraceae bacterium]